MKVPVPKLKLVMHFKDQMLQQNIMCDIINISTDILWDLAMLNLNATLFSCMIHWVAPKQLPIPNV